MILNFFPFMVKFISPHQKDVTKVLSIVCQAVHSLIPPNVLTPLIRVLADKFVSDTAFPEVIAIGLNTIREICSRQPLSLEGEEDLVKDLLGYRKFKNKGVVNASRSLLSVLRESFPQILNRRELGKDGATHALGERPLFGRQIVQTRVTNPEMYRTESDIEEKSEMRSGDGDVVEEKEEEEEIAESPMDVGGESEDGEEFEEEVDGEDEEGDEEESEEEMIEGKEESEEIVSAEAGEVKDEAQMISESATERSKEADEAKSSSKSSTELPPEFTRLLTDDELARIRSLKRDGEEMDADFEDSDESDREDKSGGSSSALVDPSSLGDESGSSGKRTREERMRSVLRGREDRPKLTEPKWKRQRLGGTTNQEKAKSKPFQMVRDSVRVRQKAKMSFRQRQSREQKGGRKQFGK